MTSARQTLFSTLHNDYQHMVFQLCMGFMKNDRDLARDLSQEVFINTWNALDKFKGASSYKTRIYRIAVNTCLKYIRDKKDKLRVDVEQVSHKLTDEPDKKTAEDNQVLYSAIGQLEELDRLIIMMVLDEMEYHEIASVMGISEGTLRVKIHRIKKNLKEKIQYVTSG